MNESPLFAKLKQEGRTSTNPLKESFGKKENFKMVLLALFGITMGQGVIWYTSQFYAQSFLLTKCFVEYEQANSIILIALLIATPFFVVFGSLSDRWGRKNIMLLGMLLGVLFYRPIFDQLYSLADPPQKVILSEVKTDNREPIAGTSASLITVTTVKTFDDGSVYKETMKQKPDEQGNLNTTSKKEIKLGERSRWQMIALIAVMVLFVTMVYGPVAAFLVELFPTRIRYTSMSLPYHIGNGVFGGLVPFIATLITTIPGTNHLSGLWYPIIVATISFIIGSLYISHRMIHHTSDQQNTKA